MALLSFDRCVVVGCVPSVDLRYPLIQGTNPINRDDAKYLGKLSTHD